MNDVNWGYDETLAKLQEIHAYEVKKNKGQQTTPQEDSQNENNKGNAKATLNIVYKGSWLLNDLITWTKDSFFSEMFIGRIGSILCSFLCSLHGDQSNKYQVDCEAAIKFDSTRLLGIAINGLSVLSVR